MTEIAAERNARAKNVCRKWSEVQTFLRALPDPHGRIAALDHAIERLGEVTFTDEFHPERLLPEIHR